MEAFLTEFLWDYILLSLIAIGFIYGYILGQDLHKNNKKKCNLFAKNVFKKTIEESEASIVNRKILNSTLASLAFYNIRADRISPQAEIEATTISIFNYHDCGVCIWDETIANPTVLFDSTCISVQLKPGKELRIYPAKFSVLYRITEEHYPPESLEEMAQKINALAKNYHV